MIKSRFIVAIFAATSLLLIACGSTPKEEPELSSVAEEKIDESFVDGKESEAETNEEKTEGSVWEKLESSRQAAIDANAENACPNAFSAAEEEYASLREARENGEDGTERAEALSAFYKAMKAFADAISKKEVIDENSWSQYNTKSYNEGNALIEELSSSEEYGDDWNQKAFSADEKMDEVLNEAYKALSREVRSEAFKAKMKADSVKCAVSRKQEYEKYVAAFKAGDQNYVTKNPKGALENYTKARDGFETLYEEVSEARSSAQDAVDDAKKRVSESEKNAEWADKEKPLDSPIEGIEDADTKLLEDDDFTDAENAAIDIDENIEEPMEEAVTKESSEIEEEVIIDETEDTSEEETSEAEVEEEQESDSIEETEAEDEDEVFFESSETEEAEDEVIVDETEEVIEEEAEESEDEVFLESSETEEDSQAEEIEETETEAESVIVDDTEDAIEEKTEEEDNEVFSETDNDEEMTLVAEEETEAENEIDEKKIESDEANEEEEAESEDDTSIIGEIAESIEEDDQIKEEGFDFDEFEEDEADEINETEIEELVTEAE